MGRNLELVTVRDTIELIKIHEISLVKLSSVYIAVVPNCDFFSEREKKIKKEKEKP